MTRKQVWRYYCEHCHKSGCSASHMAKHERHCTANPNRECRMCKTKHRYYFKIVAEFERNDLDWLRDRVDGCPNCMLAVIRQTGHAMDYLVMDKAFDYKKEREAWWTEQNDLDAQAELDSYRY